MNEDAARAGRQAEATRLLLERGASNLPARPWIRGTQPPSAVDLIRHVLWRAAAEDRSDRSAKPLPADTQDLQAALALVSAARSEMDAAETALLFLARAQGLTWAQVAASLELRSAQAAQQRLNRLLERPGSRDGR